MSQPGPRPEGADTGPRAADLARGTARGTRVVMLGQGGRIALQMISVVVLARLLTPGDYGRFALVLTIVALGEVLRDFGLSTAAIQAPSLSRAQQSNLAWINLAMGCALALLVLALAPLIADAIGDPSSTGLIRLMSLSFVVYGATAQYRADLNRNLRFGGLVLTDIVGMAVGVSVGVVGALAGLGYWALALQQLAGLTVTLVLAGSFAGWLPRLPDRSASVRPFLRFGLGMVGTQAVGYLNNNVDTLVIGIRMSPSELGVYNRAYQLLMQTLNQFRNPTTTIALPVLSKLDPGSRQAGEAILRGQAALGYTLVLGTAFAAGAAEPIIGLALGPRWDDAVPLFAILAAAGGLQTIGFVSYWVFISRALTGRLFGYSVLSLSIRVACVLVGSSWGVVGVAVGYATAPLLALPISYHLLGRWTPLPVRALSWGAVRIIGCAVLAAGASGAACWATRGLPDPAQIVAALAATLASYAVVGLLVRRVRADLRGVLDFARAALGRRI